MSSAPSTRAGLPPPKHRAGPPHRGTRLLRLRRWAVLAAVVLLLAALPLRLLDTPPARARLRGAVARALEARWPAARLEGDARVDGLLRLAFGPVVVRGAAGPAVARAEQVLVRPSLRALLSGRLEPASAVLAGVRVEAGPRGEGAAELVDALRPRRDPRRAGAARPDPGRSLLVTIDSAVVSLGGGRELGPISGEVELEQGAGGTTTRARLAGPASAWLELTLGGREGARSLSLRLRGAAPDDLPAWVRARLPAALEGGTVDLDLDAPRLATAGEARFDAAVQDLALRAGALAVGTLGPLTGRALGTVRWDVPARRVEVVHARVELGASGRVAATLEAAIQGRPEPEVSLDFRADAVDWAAAMAALPPGLSPPPQAPRLQGSVSGRVRLEGPLRDPAAWRLEVAFDPSRLATAPGPAGDPDLRSPFTWEAPAPDGGARRVVVGPSSPDFVPLASLPAHLVRAVLASEDAGFYAHHGFDFEEIQDALAHARERRRVRGASTISQQVAKNLFLSPERTAARKVREALATVALETALGKRRLLEIYLNVAEWGAGVHGVGAAARHWFGKDVRALDAKEAAFLATILPSPLRSEQYRRRGALTEVWEARVRDLLVKLNASGALGDDALQAAFEKALVFARGA